MIANKTWLWWSSGKDSAWTLHVLRQNPEYNVTALVTTADLTAGKVAAHGVPLTWVKQQASALGLPLQLMDIPYPSANTVYEAAVKKLLHQAEAEGVTLMAFGDLFLQDIKNYREKLLADSPIQAIFPLWQCDTTKLAQDMLAAGLQAHLIAVNEQLLSAEFLGRTFDEQLLAELPDSVDPCGENGEFHTFVTYLPEFSESVNVGYE